MGTVEKNKKPFKPSEYRRNVFFLSFLIAVCAIGVYTIFSWSEEEIDDYINDNSRSGEIRFGKFIIRIMVRYLGKTGFVIIMSGFCMIIFYEFYKQVAEYRRYKKKCKLYQEGVINNIYDIYEDYVPVSLWHRIKTCFLRKGKMQKYERKYPSNQKMKRQIKKHGYSSRKEWKR